MVDSIVGMLPECIVYVSCDCATLARDVKRFSEKGYRLQTATAVDIFPRTAHVETVCCLYRPKDKFISAPYEPKDASYMKTMQ